MKNKTIKLLTVSAITLGLTACGASERLANIGKAPEMAKIENPQLTKDYEPVTMPMPAPEVAVRQPNSLWDSNRTTFFNDQRADDIGDILTVLIDIDDEAELENETERTRNASENAALPSFLGYEASLGDVLPEGINPASLVGLNGDSNHNGAGSTEREEEIELRLAATITQVLPNGNLVIYGKQEARVNFEKRILQIQGVIRPEDVSINNTINHDQIAEARIVYGGEGQITDVQQPRYGQQVYDVIFPF